jgi:hypothetical protein
VATLGSAVTTKNVDEGEETHTSGYHGSGGIPNISPGSTSARFDNTDKYPFFGRTIPTNAGQAMALCIYLDSINVRQLAVLHVNDNYGMDFLVGVQNAGRQFGISVSHVSFHDGLEEPLTAVSRLAEEGYKYFFGIFSVGTTEKHVLRLYDQGLMTRPDLVWMFCETMYQSFGRKLSTNNTEEVRLAEALNGTGAVLLNPQQTEQGILQQLLKDFQGDDVLVESYLSSHLSGPLVGIKPNLFLDIFEPTPSIYAMMAYDAVMALGIGACEIESDFFTGPELFESFKKVDFRGATGTVFSTQPRGSEMRASSHISFTI